MGDNYYVLTPISYDVGVKRYFAPNWCLRIAPLQSSSRNSTNIRNPLIYCVNRYFLMFCGSQVQKPYRASTNGFLSFCPWHHHIIWPIYLISVHIPRFSWDVFLQAHILELFPHVSRSGGHVMLADRQRHLMEELLENRISNRVRNSGWDILDI